MLNWQYSDVEKVASVLLRTNPSARSHFGSVETFTQWIKNHCNLTMQKPGYCSTYGFCVTVFTIDGDTSGELHAKATLSPYGIDKFINNEAMAI